MMGWALIINNLGRKCWPCLFSPGVALAHRSHMLPSVVLVRTHLARRYPVYWIYPGALVNPPTVSPSVVPHSPAPFSGGDGPQPAPREKKLLELHDPERSAKAPLGEGSGGWKAGSDQGRQDKNRSPEEGRGGGLHPHKERNGVMVEQNAKMKSPRTSTAAPSYPTSADLAAAINIVPVHTVAPPAAPAFYQPATATLPPSPTAPVPVRASTTPALSASASQKSAYASASASASASALAANTAGSRPSMDTSGRRSSSTRRIVRHTQAARGADVPTVPAVQWR